MAAWVVDTGSPILEATSTVVAAEKIHGKTPGIAQGGNALANGFDHPGTAHGNSQSDTDTAKQQKKNRHRHGRAHGPGFHQKIDHRERSNGIGHIIGALGQGHVARGADLYAPKNIFRTPVLFYPAKAV